MTNLARYHAANLPDLFEKITKNSIGMDDYLNSFFNSDFPQSNYPPYNLKILFSRMMFWNNFV